MPKRNVVVDDDLELVSEFIVCFMKHVPGTSVIGPPDLLLDLRDIREKSADAGAIILDLKMGGSGTYGRAILKNIRSVLKRSDIPVVIWSKYLSDTVLFEPGGIIRMDTESDVRLTDIDNAGLAALADFSLIKDLRNIYSGVRAFVTKAVPEPVLLMMQVLHRSGVIRPAPLKF